MSLENPRFAFDGRIRYTIAQENGTIYLYRYVGVTGVAIPFLDGAERKSVMIADGADIDFCHNFLVVDNVDVATMVSLDKGETWMDRTAG